MKFPMCTAVTQLGEAVTTELNEPKLLCCGSVDREARALTQNTLALACQG